MSRSKFDYRARQSAYLGLGASALALLLAGAAQAQESTEVQEVVVTGFRGSLAQAIELKRDSDVAVDAIMAEDIADFPDLNLAEAIQRIPGVSIARDAGEGRQITIRGLGPDFTRVRINGMEALATTGGTDSSGGTNRGRAFDFNIFASELFNSIVVQKSPSADQEEGSLGATVDLRTARPFDYSEPTMVVSAQYGYNDLSGDWDPRVAALFSRTWAEGRLGALFSVAYAQRHLLEEGHSTVRWQQGPMQCPSCTPTQQTAINTAFTPRIPRYGVLTHEQERLGLTGSLQFRPSDATLFTLDALYAKFDATRTEDFLEVPDFSNGGTTGRAGIIVREFEIDGDNDLVFGAFDNIDVRSESRFDELSTEYTQITLAGEHRFSDSFKVDGVVGWAESDHRNPIQTTLLFDRLNTNGFSYDYRDNDRLPNMQYGFDVTDPASWTLTQIRLRPQFSTNTYSTFQLNGDWELNDNFTIEGGGFYKRYDFDTIELRRSNGTTANLEAIIPADIAAIGLTQYSRLVSLADQWGIPGTTPLTWLVPDVRLAQELFGLNDPSRFPLGPEPSLGNNRSVVEEDTGGNLQARFRFNLGAMPVRGNLGVRYVHTNQVSNGFQLAAGAPVPLTVERSYDDWLPALNLVFEPTDKVLVRASAGRVMTRPGLGGLTPGGSVTVSGNNRTVTSGNPFLDPTRGTSLDFAVEWYFAPQSLISAAFFYKDIDSFVANEAITRPFTGNPLGIPDSVAVAACGSIPGCSPAADWVFNQPVNTDGGELHGFELNYQQPFSFLPSFWSNFGVLLNYTYVDSEIEYPGGIIQTLQGLSKNAYNATLYYEDDRFSARVSAAYRDSYLSQVPGRNGNDVEGVNATLNVDAAASYSITRRLRLTLEALNLTDEPANQFVDTTDRVFVYHHTGRQFYLGLRYTF